MPLSILQGLAYIFFFRSDWVGWWETRGEERRGEERGVLLAGAAKRGERSDFQPRQPRTPSIFTNGAAQGLVEIIGFPCMLL